MKWIQFLVGFAALCAPHSIAAERLPRYFAHPAMEDRYGVIAPWYRGQNGQLDFRIRVAAETIKRYPWVTPDRAPLAGPEYAFNNTWQISPEGEIKVLPIDDWVDGCRGQMQARVLMALAQYYRYSGDPAAIAHLEAVANVLLELCQTGSDHPWPNFPISVPVRGKPYAKADPRGWIQLDIVGEAGMGLLWAYQVTGNRKFLAAAKHWGDVLARKRNRTPGAAPWGRYANPEEVAWGKSPSGNQLTGGIVYLLALFDELIRLGYTGENNRLIEARDIGRAWLRDELLPTWLVNDRWGRNYWDWEDPVQSQTTTDWVARYLMANPKYFPNWKNDARNIMSLFLNHTGVNPESRGGCYGGAWAFPESLSCCGDSLAWGPSELALAFAEYGVRADSEWGRELARRMTTLATYDVLETGVVEDKLEGGIVAAGGWFNGTHPSALLWTLSTLQWLPEATGPCRENHIMRSSAIVKRVVYGKGRVEYETFDAPEGTVDVLRLAFEPRTVRAGQAVLERRTDLNGNGFTVKKLDCGDAIVSIQHDGWKEVQVEGDDPQQVLDDRDMKFEGEWTADKSDQAIGGEVHQAHEAGAALSLSFKGNQARVIAPVGPDGGRADVYLDGVRQVVGIDYWNPYRLDRQIVYYKNGLAQGSHTLRITARGEKNPLAQGCRIAVDAFQYSEATGNNSFGEGGGPTGEQRMIFGYPERKDYLDTRGHAWRPATEFVARTGNSTDSVAKTWNTLAQAVFVENTDDPALYQFGVHWPDIVINVTVGPGIYHARLKFAETQFQQRNERGVTVAINGRMIAKDMDILATAGGPNRAADLVLNGIEPQNGIIQVRLAGSEIAGHRGEALIQALEIGPSDGGAGASPVCLVPR